MTLHLVRAGAAAIVVAPDDWVVHLAPLHLVAHGAPPRAPGPLDHAQLVALVFAADRVVTW